VLSRFSPTRLPVVAGFWHASCFDDERRGMSCDRGVPGSVPDCAPFSEPNLIAFRSETIWRRSAFNKSVKQPTRRESVMLLLKYGLATLSSGLWVYGLVDQFDSLASTAKYVVISLVMVALSLL